MAIFLSTFVNKLDKKGRVSVPSTYRNALVGQPFQGIIAYRSHSFSAIEACGYDMMERLVASADQLEFFSDGRHDLASVIFADCEQIGFDGEGRIMLSESLIAHAGLEEQAAFVGNGSTFQIWHPATFKAHQAQARARLQAKGMGLSLASSRAFQEKDAAA